MLVLGIGLDQLTKYWIAQAISKYAVIPVIPDFFNLVHVYNLWGCLWALILVVSRICEDFFYWHQSGHCPGAGISVLAHPNRIFDLLMGLQSDSQRRIGKSH